MYIKFAEEEDEFSRFNFIEEENRFQIISRSGRNIVEYSPTLILDSEYNPDKFEAVFLNNKREDCSENSIFQVMVENNIRIGWIFQIQALLSKEHDYANDKYFLKYAYVASYILLNKIASRDKNKLQDEINICDYYDTELNVLVLDKENCSKIGNFSLDDYIVDLFKFGYSINGVGNLLSNIERPNKKRVLHKQSAELNKIAYIKILFNDILSQEQESFARFHTLYQIVELLIAIIFDNDFKGFVSALNCDTENLFDKRDELSSMTSEKGRIKKLFNQYVKIEVAKENTLNNVCKELLEKNNRELASSYYDNLYAVRCLLVHRLYSLDKTSDECLKAINIAFLDVIIEILLTFRTP